MADYNEYKLEEEIAEHLAANGWHYSRTDDGYDRARALWPDDVFTWLEETQPDQFAKYGRSDVVLDALVKRLNTPMEAGGGSLNVLRRGFQHIAASFRMAQFQPESSRNETAVANYARNRLRVVRQVHFSTADNRSIDMVLFVNGIPVATIELKTDFTQSVDDAVEQYRRDRKPKTNGRDEPLLGFGTRALVHFAVSNVEVRMTTRLAGEKTHFLPFNRGTADGGAGNPPAADGKSATAYLWEEVFARDALLGILGRFMHLEKVVATDPITGRKDRSTRLLFPRFHQWDAVRKLAATTAAEGVGQKYLIQHSAGSGKTNTIAWTAHRLARLQVADEKVFDTVIVVTDRNVLDAQLQDALKQISNDAGIVASIDAKAVQKAGAGSKSKLLTAALDSGKLIIVVTLQTFPFVAEELGGLVDKRFAVIADEAHSSQTGQAATKLKSVLTRAEIADLGDGGEVDTEALLAAAAQERGSASNISYYAFTATPKAKTLEIFGRTPPGGDKPEPFHVYSMKQAIEENYILDVLRGYHSYLLAARLATEGGEVEVDQTEATKQAKRWLRIQAQTIAQKSTVIVEHFRENVAHLLDGHAKAMVVADSRLAAVRYKREIDRYIATKGYVYQTLVAFSGSVDDPEFGVEGATEATLNPGAGDLRSAFMRDENRIMIVANKFQTGFDQPLLCAMYVDKRLSGVTTVQTLSRLNRTYRTPDGVVKDTTMIVDFVNNPDEVLDDFRPYYRDAHLDTITDPNLVWELKAKLDAAGVYDDAELRRIVDVWLKRRGNQALDSALAPVTSRYTTMYTNAKERGDKATVDALEIFKKDVSTFNRVYDFLSQIYDYSSVELEERSIAFRLLERRLSLPHDPGALDLSSLQIVALKLRDRGSAELKLEGDDKGLRGVTAAGSGAAQDPKMVALSEVVELLNELLGAEELGRSQVESFIEALVANLAGNDDLRQQARVNTIQQFAESPDFDEAVVDAVADNQSAFKTVADFFYTDAPMRQMVMSRLAGLLYAEVAG
ncbi:MAG TPA: type I restriction endonuclease [Gordonia sp. (in: high G+C Gram-positive bacteria)]|uniref:type I restriction endonuclease subunit R n=1 Tax=unclassified Gordonia (in: high G+C Gram-positive bacteria) TaxID=2657482 RepID=UPI000F93108E|nr:MULTISPECIES: type I restriction endonuclease [unclassified Gordonia (in: high G+C Gram-positive bacteria)]RUP39269.1 MAG: type I restriction endonuclease subunit R [Gordonia sp. (in: high G+C Gram-positive bacteria)]HNP58762.1 type I restriction endonuclease [Gordonia sp. (in: high G+C Gram-positive bacteria)]HRC52447.1 type I restriction endonuclease [Gordonia sp. (in: high G+C Gram-positive bacteria)]